MIKATTKTIFDTFWAAPWIETASAFYSTAQANFGVIKGIDAPGERTVWNYIRAKKALFQMIDSGKTENEAINRLLKNHKLYNISGDAETKAQWHSVIKARQNYELETKAAQAEEEAEKQTAEPEPQTATQQEIAAVQTDDFNSRKLTATMARKLNLSFTACITCAIDWLYAAAAVLLKKPK